MIRKNDLVSLHLITLACLHIVLACVLVCAKKVAMGELLLGAIFTGCNIIALSIRSGAVRALLRSKGYYGVPLAISSILGHFCANYGTYHRVLASFILFWAIWLLVAWFRTK